MATETANYRLIKITTADSYRESAVSFSFDAIDVLLSNAIVAPSPTPPVSPLVGVLYGVTTAGAWGAGAIPNSLARWTGTVWDYYSPGGITRWNDRSVSTTVWVLNSTWSSETVEARAIAAPLTGLSFASSAKVVASDTVLQAIGKLQAQLDVHFP